MLGTYRTMFASFVVGLGFGALALAETPSAQRKDYSTWIFQRLVGTPLLSSDKRKAEMDALIAQGKPIEAAKIATEDPGFYSVTLRDWAAAMSNREETPMVELDDFQAQVIGSVRDDLDARELLTANYRYEGDKSLRLPIPALDNNEHYAQLSLRRTDLKKYLVKRSPQWEGIGESAGLLTTRAWAKAHFSAGTNRRATEFTFREFLCTPITQWKDMGLPDYRVRRDVDRRPGGDPETYQTTCRSCHAAMDGLTGAFASFDFVGEILVHNGMFGVSAKMNQNGNVYTPGYVTSDNFWVNLATKHHNEAIGWRGPIDGVGVKEFGAMVSNAKGFSQCLVQRVFRKVCRRELRADEKTTYLEGLADRFESGGYKLRRLFEEIATQKNCQQS